MVKGTMLGELKIAVVGLVFLVSPVVAEEFVYKEKALARLVEQVPRILANFDAETGRFGTGIWIVTDQNVMFPLAVAYATKGDMNPHYKDGKLLDTIMKAGDALIADADQNGQWEFRKKDGSTWGKISMPWTYSRWIRSYALIREDMPAERKAAWEKALILGYEHIGKTALGSMHNIPTHHAMGLYIAGKAFERPAWCEQAATFMHKVADKQAEGGYWSENFGPVVNYNFVYVDAIGTYYALSRDPEVLSALQRSASFHYHFRYPDGAEVETIDERNPYHAGVVMGNVGFTFTPTGRAFLKEQWEQNPNGLSADIAASLLLYGEEGEVAIVGGSDAAAKSQAASSFVLSESGQERAATIRMGPWFICLSAYVTTVPKNRWHQDRQNLVSIYHDKLGLILGGGNTKMQPAWSNFTVGDMKLLQHKAGDEKPDFMPKGELYHLASVAALVKEPLWGLDLKYGQEDCQIHVEPKDERTLVYHLSATTKSGLPVLAHLTLLPRMGEALTTGTGKSVKIADKPVDFGQDEIDGRIRYAGYTLEVPAGTSLHWPALPHNPYRKDGRAQAAEGRIEIRIPFDKEHQERRVILTVDE